MKKLIIYIFICFALHLNAQISHLRIKQVEKDISFSFSFSPNHNNVLVDHSILIEYSFDGGKSYKGMAKSVKSNFGESNQGSPKIIPNRTNVLTWEVLKDLSDFSGQNIVFRLTAYETDIVFGDKPSIGTLILPTPLRSNSSMKSTNLFYSFVTIAGIAYLSRDYWYNKYLKASNLSEVSVLYNRANYSNQAMMVSVGLSGAVFSINIGKLLSNRTKYASIRRKAKK